MSQISTNRRFFLRGAITLIASPAIVRASSLMPIKNIQFLEEEMLPNAILQKLLDVTRRAYIPRMFIDIYYASSTFEVLTKNG